MKIAIDGPAGSGKSTIAKLLSQKLSFKHVDTGAYYRWLTYHAMQNKLDLRNGDRVSTLAQTLDFTNIDDSKIRSVEVSNNVSLVSAHKEVRPFIVAQQRKAAANTNVVMEGRDIGSVVFPDAEVKIFLNATVAERAERRYKELLAKGQNITLAEIKKDIEQRDHYDSTREHSPLKKTADALEVDTTGLTIEAVVEKIAALVKQQ